MNLQEICSVCRRNNHNGFWWRVFTPEYSRNIWCELAAIVGFRRTTVCLVKGEQRCLKERQTFKRRFLLCATVLKPYSLLNNERNMALTLLNAAVTENVCFHTLYMPPWEVVFLYICAQPAPSVALPCLRGLRKHVWALLFISHSWPCGGKALCQR